MEFGGQGIKEAEFMRSSLLQEKASGGFAEKNFEAPTAPEGDPPTQKGPTKQPVFQETKQNLIRLSVKK